MKKNRRLFKRMILLHFWVMGILFLGTSAKADTIYVDVDVKGLQTGLSWGDAYNHLQDAINRAESKDEIWVAEGNYYPDRSKAFPDGTGDRALSFHLINGVRIYGGFDPGSGIDTLPERSWKIYQTVLSGNIGEQTNSSDNSYHVVKNIAGQDNSAVLDGFYIKYGNADGQDFPDNTGAGMHNGKTSPTTRNCFFSMNTATEHGAGMYNGYASPFLIGCEFEGNEADSGAAMTNDHSSPELTDCLFINNHAKNGSGGGIYNKASDSKLTNCLFIGNSASYGGGGIYNYDTCTPVLYNCVFSGNTSIYGGGVHNSSGISFTALNCTFNNNTAKDQQGNDGQGSGIYSRGNSFSYIFNSILWNDVPDEIFNSSDSGCEVGNSDVQTDTGNPYPGNGNITADPQLTGDFHLMQVSPCIDKGDNTKVPGELILDFEKDPRMINQIVDMGVDEFDESQVVGVDHPDDLEQMAAFTDLKQVVGPENFNVTIHRGAIERLDLNLEKIKPSPEYSADNFAMDSLGEYPSLFGLTDPSIEFRLKKRVGDDRKVLIFDQYYKNIPIFGSWLKMNVQDKGDIFKLRSLTGNYSPDVDLDDLIPKISSMEALNQLADHLGINDIRYIQLAVPTKLWLFDDALRTDDPPCDNNQCPDIVHNTRLAWRMTYYSCQQNGALADAFIDAETGEVIYNIPRVYFDDPKIRISTAMGNTSKTCFGGYRHSINAWFDQDGECATYFDCSHPGNYCHWDVLHCAHPNLEGYEVFDYTWDIYNFYYDLFRRRSYDGGDHGKKMWMFLDVGFPSENASSNDCGAYRVHYFSTGMATLDIMGHEFAHSVHADEADFVYTVQSGAVAEHIADMFGHFLGFWTGLDPDWKHGEDGSGADSDGCGRDMEDPSRCDQPDTWNDRNFTSPPYNRSNDYGGVHYNCGILNKAGYLMVEGGVVDLGTVVGIGEEKVRRIYYETVKRLGSNPSFRNFADDVVDTCHDFVGRYGIIDTDCCQISNAFAAVDIPHYHSDTDCDGITDWTDDDDDGDGIIDSLDNCLNVANPRQENHDSDRYGDACDDDVDGDGILNVNDDCPLTPGVGDVCLDSDGDGTMNAFDNCRDTYNRDQSDIDGDGSGDVCDSDIDNDGWNNDGDNCRYIANPDQANSDTDSLGDACDNCPNYGGSTDQRDFDGDGMGDLCDPDIDNDGYDNDRDECDYESVSSSSGLIICPPNHTCRTGCLPDRILEISDFQMKFDINTAQPDPGLHEQPRLTIPLDICDLMPCETIGLFKDEDFINLTVSADLDRTDMPELIKDNPMTLTFSVLNESGVVMAASDLDFLAGDSQSGNLVFQMGPAFTMRETMPQPKGDEPDNALPSYYLSISFQYEYEACTDECVECAECEQQCGGCDDTCGHCDECTECDAVCGPCKVCEAQMRGLYATFFSQNNFEVKTQMAYEQVCGDFDDDGDVDGSDLAYLISSGKECMASFVAVFGQ